MNHPRIRRRAPASMDRSLVMLDRDGVINHDSERYIRTPADWQPLPGSLTAIAALHRAGFTVVVCTNQSGLARGLITPAELDAIHASMVRAVAAAGGELAGIFICPHGPNDGCDCRKPRPGLLHQVERRLGLPVRGAPCVGDSARDLAAATAAGARPILVRTGNGEKTLAQAETPPPEVYDDLAAVAEQLIAEVEHGR